MTTLEDKQEEKIEPTIQNNSSEIQVEEEVQKLIQLVTKQTELNGHIIKVLSDEKINKEHKQKMVRALEQGAENSKLFMDIIKEQNTNFEYENIPAKDPNIKDSMNKFKNMIASFKANIDSSIVFRNPLKPDWYEMGYKTAIVLGKIEQKTKPIQNTYNRLISFFKESAKEGQVFLQEVRATSEKIQDKIFLIGEKRNVQKLQKKFTTTFEFLGLNAKEMSSDANFVEDITKEELITKISDNLNKKFTAIKVNETYSFTILNELNPELQFEMLQNVIWPKVKSAITENMDINYGIKLTQNDNKYMKMVQDFSKDNNFNPDLVIHSLRNNHELLNGYIGTNKILQNKDKILENAAKYEKALSHNIIYLEELITISNSIEEIVKSLKVSSKNKQEFTKEMNNSIVFKKDDVTINFKQIKQNASELGKEKTNMKKADSNNGM